MDSELSVRGGFPDTTLVREQDVIQLPYGVAWDARRVALDGIVISYTNELSDAKSFETIKASTWSPHYVIVRGGEPHPTSNKRTTYKGQIFQLVSESQCAYHASYGFYPQSGFSKFSQMYGKAQKPDKLTIGISLVAKNGTALLPQQYENLGELIRDIVARNRSISVILGRRHIAWNGTYHFAEDPEPYTVDRRTIDFSDESIFGTKAGAHLNKNFVYTSDGRIIVYNLGKETAI